MAKPTDRWGFSQRIRQVPDEVLQVNQGALYPALHRLEQQGWIRGKYYSQAPDGATRVHQEQAQCKHPSSTIGLVLEMS